MQQFGQTMLSRRETLTFGHTACLLWPSRLPVFSPIKPSLDLNPDSVETLTTTIASKGRLFTGFTRQNRAARRLMPICPPLSR